MLDCCASSRECRSPHKEKKERKPILWKCAHCFDTCSNREWKGALVSHQLFQFCSEKSYNGWNFQTKNSCSNPQCWHLNWTRWRHQVGSQYLPQTYQCWIYKDIKPTNHQCHSTRDLCSHGILWERFFAQNRSCRTNLDAFCIPFYPLFSIWFGLFPNIQVGDVLHMWDCQHYAW